MNTSCFHRPALGGRRKGVALVVILAFVALLTALVLAYFSYSSLQRQISSASSNQTTVDLFARGAVNTIVGDLRQEIVAGSTISTVTAGSATVTNYFPSTNFTAVPAVVGFSSAAGLENLVKISRNGTNFFPSSANYDTATYPSANRAAGVSSTNTSQNGRAISLARWNKALLLSATAATNGAFVAPDWILVNRAGGNPTTWNTNLIWSGSAATTTTVIGRYAYAIYDEGGLLDINVAGFPPGTASSISGYKYGGMPYADLTQIGLTNNTISALVGWRNAASAQPAGSFPSYSFNSTSQSNYFKAVLQNNSGFLRTANTSMATTGESDRLFVSRQELLKFFDTLAANGIDTKANLQSAARYLGTFSRAIEQPSYAAPIQSDPAAPVVLSTLLGGNNAVGKDKLINPSFPKTRVQAAFTRNDGSTAKVGDPLVNKRFALQRLAWITYKGPSSTRSQSDADIQSLINNGITWDYLQQGTPENIQKYFGLNWDNANSRWKYNVHNGGSTGAGPIMRVGRPQGPAPDATTYVQDANREPDFFELLKAGISVGSLGKAAQTSNDTINPTLSSKAVPYGYQDAEIPANFYYNFDSSVDYHIIQIGANILSAVNPTSFPVRIAFNDGSRGLWEFQGVTDLPYLTYVFNGVLRTELSSPAANYGSNVDNNPFQFPTATGPGTATVTTPGNAYAIQLPAVWNPYDPNGTQGVPRPGRFRVVIDSNDPVSLANGASNHPVWCAGLASPRTGAPIGGNDGLGAPWIPGSICSYQATQNPTSPTGVPVSDSVTFNDNNGALYREPTLIFSTNVGGASRTAGNITPLDLNPLGNGDSGPFAPLVIGQFPLAFHYSNRFPNGANYDTRPNPILYAGLGAIGHGGALSDSAFGDNRVYFTYRLQYQDSSGNWITYDTKYGRTTYGRFPFQSRGSFSSCVIKAPDGFSPYSWAAAIDPRSSRFGLMMDVMNHRRGGGNTAIAPPINMNDGTYYGVGNWAYNSNGNNSPTQAITYSIRPDNLAGLSFANVDSTDEVNVIPLGGHNNNALLTLATPNSMIDVPFPSFAAGWTRPIRDIGGNVPTFIPGMYAQNNSATPWYVGRYSPDSPQTGIRQPSYYADADGVVRRATGAYVAANTSTGASAATPIGLPTASIQGFPNQNSASLKTPASQTPFTQSQSRPLLLHRPFRTVAELGYVFRDVPWKNLDFFTPESGDAALLDIFCISETGDSNGLVAGKVNLNTRQSAVLNAIVSGAYVDDPKITDTTVGTLSSTLANSIATALTTRTADNANFGPMQNISELVGKWNARADISPGFSYDRSVPAQNSGVDLPAGNYGDGKISYVGFSGATSVSGTPKELTSVYGAAANFPNASLQTSVAQIQRFREAPIRALASVGQTRVWNLMIDIVAQTGRYPQSATTLDKFVVEGEQRYWVHLAIDRLTGNVIDKQIEVVKE